MWIISAAGIGYFTKLKKGSGDDSIIQTLKKHAGPLIECFVLSFPLILMAFLTILSMILKLRRKGIDLQAIITEMLLDTFMTVILSVLIFNFIFYSVLKKKYNFELNVLLYGIGFMSCCVTFVLFMLILLHGPFERGSIEPFFWFFYVLPFTTLYYSYAALLQNNEKNIDRVILCLSLITLVSFAGLIIFEIIKYQIPYVGVFLFLFGSYLVYCLTSKKSKLSLQLFAWTPCYPALSIFLYVIWYAFVITPF